MKCPKCGYLGFEDADRCRNCGYEFSLATPVPVPELPLRASSPELPLFGSPHEVDDEPLIKQASAPRTPLSVRRSTPEISRVRPEQPRPQSFDLTAEESVSVQQLRQKLASIPRRSDESVDEPESVEPAGVLARLLAVAIDVMILVIVDAVVIYFTLRILGLTLEDVAVLPKGPMIAFLLVQNGGYLVAFTAGGQTLGKMAAGIRVVPSEPHAQLDISHAFVREALWLVLAAPAGLGFLPALFSRDRRGLHDRLAGTRVVR